MENSESELELTPPDSVEAANNTCTNLIPEISKEKYTTAYNSFMDWRNEQKLNSFSENVLLSYFGELSKKFKASTLWSQYSMLRTTVNINNYVDISKYAKLRAFLKRKSDGYRPKKSKIFTSEEINKFIIEAPDNEYLLAKVVLIIGVTGACRRAELYQMKITDFKDLGSAVLVEVPNVKTKAVRRFILTGHYYKIFKRYADLRPQNTNDSFFFLNYQKGRCTVQKVGINKFGNLGKQIATYLKLPNAELYTGHCFRSSAANEAATFLRHGGDTRLGSSPEYEPCMSSNSCIKTYKRIARTDLSSHGSNTDIDQEELNNIRDNCSDDKITIKEEILPEIDTPCEEVLMDLPINNSIREYKFENIDINSDYESKPNVVEIKKEIFVYPETDELPGNFDNLRTSFTYNSDATDISINKTEYGNGNLCETACQNHFDSVSKSIPRCSIGIQIEEEKDCCTADSYFNLFVREYFKEAPDSTGSAIRKMLEIDRYILKLIKCRQNWFDNFDKPDKCINNLIVPDRLPDTDTQHSAIGLDVSESIPIERKLECSYHKNSEVAGCVKSTKSGGRSGIEIVSSQIVPERLPDTETLSSARDLGIKESITMEGTLDCGYHENSVVAGCDETTKTGGKTEIKIVSGQILPERLPDTDPLNSAIDLDVEGSCNESVTMKRKLDCSYREVAACGERAKTREKTWSKTAKKRKFVNSEFQGNSEIAVDDEAYDSAYDKSKKNAETANGYLHVKEVEQESPGERICSVETENNISVPGCS